MKSQNEKQMQANAEEMECSRNKVEELERALDDQVLQQVDLEKVIEESTATTERLREERNQLKEQNEEIIQQFKEQQHYDTQLKRKDQAIQFIEQELNQMRELFTKQEELYHQRLQEEKQKVSALINSHRRMASEWIAKVKLIFGFVV